MKARMELNSKCEIVQYTNIEIQGKLGIENRDICEL